MQQHQFIGILAGLFAQICQQGDIAADDGLQAAPKFPMMLRERTTMPRTIPKLRTMRYPGSSSADVTIDESTRPAML
jgi:hypothetical protein